MEVDVIKVFYVEDSRQDRKLADFERISSILRFNETLFSFFEIMEKSSFFHLHTPSKPKCPQF
jgi:hypothetical protein